MRSLRPPFAIGDGTGIPNARIDELDARLDLAWDAVFSSAKTCVAETQPSLDRLNALFGI